MKVRTVAALTALGMMLTSFGVWSLTHPERGTSTSEPLPFFNAGRPAVEGPSAFRLDGTLQVEGRLGHTSLASDRESETFVLVNVRADERATGREARRHLSIVIDRSGSMQGKRLANAIAAAQGAVERLAEGDVVSVIEYSGTARELVAPTTLDRDARARVVREIGQLTASGETCISCALETSVEVLRRRSGMVDRVLLLSDGEATAGVRDLEAMRRVAETVRNAGATVTTVGVDVDFNERMMAVIAQETNGRHYFVENAEGLGRIFDAELRGLERSVAREARLELELEPGVELEDVSDRSFRREGSRVVIPLGAFSAGEERTVLARVRVPRGAPGERPVALARLEYEDLDSGAPARREARLGIRLSSDGSSSALDPVVKERVNRSGTVTALDQANRLFESGDGEGARRRVTDELDKVRSGRAAAVAAAPAAKKADLDRSFLRQETALGSAANAFADPPPGSAGPLDERKGKAGLKRNQAEAVELAR